MYTKRAQAAGTLSLGLGHARDEVPRRCTYAPAHASQPRTRLLAHALWTTWHARQQDNHAPPGRPHRRKHPHARREGMLPVRAQRDCGPQPARGVLFLANRAGEREPHRTVVDAALEHKGGLPCALRAHGLLGRRREPPQHGHAAARRRGVAAWQVGVLQPAHHGPKPLRRRGRLAGGVGAGLGGRGGGQAAGEAGRVGGLQ